MLEKPLSLTDQVAEIEQALKMQAIAAELLIDHFRETLDVFKIAGCKKDRKIKNLEITVDTLKDLGDFVEYELKLIDSGEMAAFLAVADRSFSTH